MYSAGSGARRVGPGTLFAHACIIRLEDMEVAHSIPDDGESSYMVENSGLSTRTPMQLATDDAVIDDIDVDL